MSQTTRSQLRTALALRLAEANLARYNESEKYSASDDPVRPAVFLRAVLPDTPDTAVTISVIDDRRDRDAHNPDLTVRLRFRGAGRSARAVDDPADAVFKHLRADRRPSAVARRRERTHLFSDGEHGVHPGHDGPLHAG
jgi:hypothetical protein